MSDAGEMSEREKLEAVLHEHIAEASDDELRVIGVLFARLDKGRQVYGALDLSADERDFEGEAGEEFADAAIYLACKSVARWRRSR